MISAKDAVVWVNYETMQIAVLPTEADLPTSWSDPIGAHYAEWLDGNDEQRVRLMLETAIDLAMQGFSLAAVLKEFAKVKEFRALGGQSYPMCRALTQALVGQYLEFHDVSFEELLKEYGRRRR